jgi:hypothetical protein
VSPLPSQNRLVKVLVAAIAVFLVGLTIAAFVYHAEVLGEELGAMTVADAPAEIVVQVPPGRTKLVPWSEFEMAGPSSLFNTKMRRYGLPRVLDYVVRVEQDGELVAERRCEIFSFSAHDDGSIRRGLSEITVKSRARLDDCVVEVPRAGEVTVRVHRAWVRELDGLTFDTTGLLWRAVEP